MHPHSTARATTLEDFAQVTVRNGGILATLEGGPTDAVVVALAAVLPPGSARGALAVSFRGTALLCFFVFALLSSSCLHFHFILAFELFL